MGELFTGLLFISRVIVAPVVAPGWFKAVNETIIQSNSNE
jgi:hypothetical protein